MEEKKPGAFLSPDLLLMLYMPCSARSSFNGNIPAGLYCLGVLLRDRQLQDTMLIFCLDVLLSNRIAYIEASLHCSRIALPPDISAVFILLGVIDIISS